MNIIGFSAGATGKSGNVDRMVQAILATTAWDREFVKLTDLRFSGCRGCVDRCAAPQVCMLDDDLKIHYERLKKADAVVLGTPNHFGTYSGVMYAFVERFFGYRHVTNAIAGKPFVAVMAGFRPRGKGEENYLAMLRRFGINVVSSIYFCSLAPPCYYCGLHKDCRIGGMYSVYGEDALNMDITPAMLRQWEDDPETVDAVQAAAAELELYAD